MTSGTERAEQGTPPDEGGTPGGDEFPARLARARAGDRDALAALLAGHLPRLEAFVRGRGSGRTGDRDAAEDLVQSTCREILERLERFDDHGEGEAAFAAWLYATATRKIADRHRYHQRQRRDAGREIRGPEPIDLGELLRTSHTPSRDVEIEQRRQLVLGALDAMPEHYREVLRLAYFEGLPRAEIAARLGKPGANAVQALLARALARLGNTLRRLGP